MSTKVVTNKFEYSIRDISKSKEVGINFMADLGWKLVCVDNGIAYFERSTEPIEFSGRIIRDLKGHPLKFIGRLGKENDD